MDRCEQCGRRLDRPSFYAACEDTHPAPTLAQRIVEAIESELQARKGLWWGHLDDELIDEIRDDMVDAVGRALEANE